MQLTRLWDGYKLRQISGGFGTDYGESIRRFDIFSRRMEMAEPIEATEANWDEQVLNSELPVLVDFWADWCGPCKMIAPSVHDMAVEYEGKLVVAKLDVDSSPNIAIKYRVSSIPALIFFKDGQPVDQIVGAVPKGQLQKKVDSVLTG